jgi:NADH:ubiquinone oxidoreductase subunit 4 (subunit M)
MSLRSVKSGPGEDARPKKRPSPFKTMALVMTPMVMGVSIESWWQFVLYESILMLMYFLIKENQH